MPRHRMLDSVTAWSLGSAGNRFLECSVSAGTFAHRAFLLMIWSCPHQTGQPAWVGDCCEMNSRGERICKPL